MLLLRGGKRGFFIFLTEVTVPCFSSEIHGKSLEYFFFFLKDKEGRLSPESLVFFHGVKKNRLPARGFSLFSFVSSRSPSITDFGYRSRFPSILLIFLLAVSRVSVFSLFFLVLPDVRLARTPWFYTVERHTRDRNNED